MLNKYSYVTESDLDKQSFLVPYIATIRSKEYTWRYIFKYSTNKKWMIVLINAVFIGCILLMLLKCLSAIAEGAGSTADTLMIGVTMLLLSVLGYLLTRSVVILAINVLRKNG